MAFQKGKSGNPSGRAKDKAFADAVRVAVNRTHDEDPDKRKKLAVLAEKLVGFAMAGESWAFQQIADRLDGKPAQEASVTIDDKRDAADWTRSELVSLIHDATKGSRRVAKADGREREADSVH